VSINNTGGVSLTGAVEAAGGGAVHLTSSAALTETGAGSVSSTGDLTTSSASGTALAGPNAVRGFNATNSTSGSVALANTRSLLTLTGISQAGGGSVAVNNAGAIGVTGSVSAVDGGSVFLTSSGALSESGAGAVATTGELKTSSAGGQTLDGSNTVSAFDATNTTSGDVTLVDAASPLDIAAISESGGASAIVKNSGPIVVQGAVSAPSKVSLGGTAFSATNSGSISAPNLALLDDGSSATTWTVTPTSVTAGAGGAVPYSDATSLTVRGGGGDTFGVTASPGTRYTLDGGTGSDGTLNYDAQNRTASGTFSPPDGEIDSPTVQPVKFTRMAAVNLLNRADRTLAVTLNGSGTVTGTGGLNCQASCSHSYDRGTAVTLSAAPASGWTFAGWGRDCSGTDVCPFTMSEDRTVTATFVRRPPPPSCSLVAQSARVRAPAPRRRGHRAPPAGILKLTARCDQQANVVLTGKVTATLKPKRRATPGRRPPRRIRKTFALSRVRASILAARPLTLKVTLPKSALTALRQGARESVALALTATNANGRSVSRTTIPRLSLVAPGR
jgi:uncharacterized repeat protein (TIGR02543 family)